MKINDLEYKALWLRRALWDMVMRQRKGHIPSSYSCAEIMVALYYGGVAHVVPSQPDEPNRDRIIVSKGHAAMVQYPILADLGFYDPAELDHFTQPGGLLGMYADFRIPGIEGISGSLGHGLGMGASPRARQDGADYLTYVVLGDGECYEGSVRIAMFASPWSDNLIVIIDRNTCILGKTEDLWRWGI